MTLRIGHFAAPLLEMEEPEYNADGIEVITIDEDDSALSKDKQREAKVQFLRHNVITTSQFFFVYNRV